VFLNDVSQVAGQLQDMKLCQEVQCAFVRKRFHKKLRRTVCTSVGIRHLNSTERKWIKFGVTGLH